MKLSELITSDGIFTELDKIDPLPWDQVVTPDELDSAFMFKNGDKTVSAKTLRMFSEIGELPTVINIAKLLSTMFTNKWGQLFEAFNMNYPLNVVSRETLNENTTGDNTSTNNVSAYDSNELVADSSVNNSNKQEHDYTKDTVSLKAVQDNIEMLQDTLIYDIVFEDVKHLILLLVY